MIFKKISHFFTFDTHPLSIYFFILIFDIFSTCQSRNYLLTCASAEMCNGRLRSEWGYHENEICISMIFVFWSCETIVEILNFSL